MTYTEKAKNASYKWRRNNPEKYRAVINNYYAKNKNDPEWIQRRREAQRISTRKHRLKIKEQLLNEPLTMRIEIDGEDIDLL